MRVRTAIVLLVAGITSVAAQGNQASKVISYTEAILTDDGKIIVHTAEAAKEDSLYQAGSISKFTCTLAIMDMVEDGRLSLDDTINTLLPEYRGPAGRHISLAHLLQNRSGLEDGVVAAFRSDRSTATASMSAIDAANRFAASPAKFTPGSEFDYIVSNWIIIQAILEHMDGASLDTVLRKRVFNPAGMSQARVFTGTLTGSTVARANRPTRPVPGFIACAGGVAATTADLIKLVRHPYQTAGLSSREIQLLTSLYSEDEAYALGGRYRKLEIAGQTRILSWQSGSNGAYKSIAIYDPVADQGYAIMTADGALIQIEKRRDIWLARYLE